MNQKNCQNVNVGGEDARVLVFSQRNFDHKVYQCWMYEFEDIISKIDSVRLIAPSPCKETKLSNFYRRTFNQVRKHANPGLIKETIISQRYELFFTIVQFPSQLLLLQKLKGWRENCKKAVCYLSELWLKDLDQNVHLVNILEEFDYIFVHINSSKDAVADTTKRPCYFLPVGVDAVRFCPYPSPPVRSIDCYSMGRRLQLTHKALLEIAERKNFFYVYDTVNDFSVTDYREHRSLIANLIKRSRYFISYKHNVNIKHITGGQEALGARMFEGMAGGAVLLGLAPDCEEYHACFDWPDAVIPIPHEPTDLEDVLNDLDAQSDRLASARQTNIINALRRHDWVYRWKTILSKVNLQQTEKMKMREQQLDCLSELVRESPYIGQTLIS